MKRTAFGWGIVRADGGQALTEFAIVIPVVLFLFFAILQYWVVAQNMQLVSYAAYAAARSYVVNQSVPGDAQDTATTAAALAVAPVARLMPGELQIVGFDLSSLQAQSPFTALNLGGDFVSGYLVAKYFRFNPGLLGGSVQFSTSANGGLPQVDVVVNYPQPIYIPGLAELWAVLAGDQIFTSLNPLAQGLTGLPAEYAQFQLFREAVIALEQALGNPFPDVPDIAAFIKCCPYVNLRGKCTMGLENWGAKPVWRPRQPGQDNWDPAHPTDPIPVACHRPAPGQPQPSSLV